MYSARALLAALAIVAAVALASAAVGDEWRPSQAEASATEAVKKKRIKLTLKDSPYGKVVFANGYAMYVFTKDEGSRSRCYGRCVKAWPPLRHRRRIVAGAGIDESLISSTRRRDGTKQLTYAGRPLYGYVHDPRARVLCHDVVEFGGTWYAVQGPGTLAPS
jgi:predicted lipoprotein with Yx(FWY)xxD motif